MLACIANPTRLVILALAAACALQFTLSRSDGVSVGFRPVARAVAPRVNVADEAVLHMIMAVFNPANYSSRPRSARAQQARFRATRGAILYTAELAYGDAPFMATDADNPRHLQVRYADRATPAVVWAKENLLNLAVRHLLPKRFAALGFVDAEIVFKNPDWAVDALLQIQEGRSEVLQPFAHALFEGVEVPTHGFERARLGASFEMPRTVSEWLVGRKGGRLSGYSWVYSFAAWQRMGGAFYDKDLGTLNDVVNAVAATCKLEYLELLWPRQSAPADCTLDFLDSVRAHAASACRGASAPRAGYVRGLITHEDHGSPANRRYLSLRDSLKLFEPSRHVAYDVHGLLAPTPAMSRAIIDSLKNYYAARKEDDAFATVSLGEAMGLAGA